MTGLVESTTPATSQNAATCAMSRSRYPASCPARRDGGWFAAIDGWRRVGWLVLRCRWRSGHRLVHSRGPARRDQRRTGSSAPSVFCAVMVTLWQLVLTQKLHTAEMESQYKAHRAEMDAQRQQARLDRSHLLNQLQKQR